VTSTPYRSRSAYSGIIDLAGFRKDRFYLYQAQWRPGLTPLAIFLDEGFEQADADPVLAIVNGTQTTMEAELNEGDEVEFLIGISGG
jgi:hypothetical protein